MSVTIREAEREADADTVWRILQPAVEAGETFCADPTGGKAGGLAYFWPPTARVWIAEVDGEPLGCTYLKPNQTGNGAHVCNAGYCTLPQARGNGIARAMLDHSLAEARRQAAMAPDLPKELGGRDGPEPVRFGDWENKGIAVDF